jgi:hypothetical protein
MQAKGHGDSQIEAHPQTHVPMNLRPEMSVAAHLHLVCRIESATQSPSKSGKSLQRSQGGRGSESEVIPAPKAGRRQRGPS